MVDKANGMHINMACEEGQTSPYVQLEMPLITS